MNNKYHQYDFMWLENMQIKMLSVCLLFSGLNTGLNGAIPLLLLSWLLCPLSLVQHNVSDESNDGTLRGQGWRGSEEGRKYCHFSFLDIKFILLISHYHNIGNMRYWMTSIYSGPLICLGKWHRGYCQAQVQSQIQVPNPKSKVQRKGNGADNIIIQDTTTPPTHPQLFSPKI